LRGPSLVTQIIAVRSPISLLRLALLSFSILDATVGLRIKPEAEVQGMDIHEHGEEGYGREFAGWNVQESEYTLEPFVSDNLRSNSTRAEFDTVSTQNLSCLVSLLATI